MSNKSNCNNKISEIKNKYKKHFDFLLRNGWKNTEDKRKTPIKEFSAFIYFIHKKDEYEISLYPILERDGSRTDVLTIRFLDDTIFRGRFPEYNIFKKILRLVIRDYHKK